MYTQRWHVRRLKMQQQGWLERSCSGRCSSSNGSRGSSSRGSRSRVAAAASAAAAAASVEQTKQLARSYTTNEHLCRLIVAYASSDALSLHQTFCFQVSRILCRKSSATTAPGGCGSIDATAGTTAAVAPVSGAAIGATRAVRTQTIYRGPVALLII